MKYFHQINTSDIKNFTILLDIDGTLACDSENSVSHDTLQVINELKEKNDIYLASNNFDSKRTHSFGWSLGLPVLRNGYKKPSKKVLKGLNIKKPILVIGDKFLTDEFFAKRIGANYIRVKRLRSKNDRWFIKLSYLVDNIIYFLYNLRKKDT